MTPSLAKQYTNDGFYARRISYLRLESIAKKFVYGTSNERIVLIPGLRGVGKTTILFQIYLSIKNYLDNNRLIYLSCDNIVKLLNSNLKEVLEVYEKKIVGDAFEKISKKIILLIDEAHYDPSWQDIIKSIYDRTKNILIIVSGSSSIAIETTSDLARRSIVERIFPLNFLEYLILKKKIYPLKDASSKIKEAIFLSNNLDESYKILVEVHQELLNKFFTKIPNLESEMINYLVHGGFPFTSNSDKEEITFSKIISIIEKIVYQDIIAFYPAYKGLITKIFPILYVISESSDKISYENLAKYLDSTTKSLIYEVLQALEKAGLVQAITIEGSAMKVMRNSMKFYFPSPTIRASLLWGIGRFNKESKIVGLLLETAVFNTLYKIKEYQKNIIQEIYYSENPGEADFKVISKNRKIIIECGWGNKDQSQINKTNAINQSKTSFIISNVKTPLIDKKNNLIYVPKEMFLLI
ncbi:MAG: AAA family ATPase [Nanoarchaeota archaeon]